MSVSRSVPTCGDADVATIQSMVIRGLKCSLGPSWVALVGGPTVGILYIA